MQPMQKKAAVIGMGIKLDSETETPKCNDVQGK